jgi:hypothetical protein
MQQDGTGDSQWIVQRSILFLSHIEIDVAFLMPSTAMQPGCTMLTISLAVAVFANLYTASTGAVRGPDAHRCAATAAVLAVL